MVRLEEGETSPIALRNLSLAAFVLPPYSDPYNYGLIATSPKTDQIKTFYLPFKMHNHYRALCSWPYCIDSLQCENEIIGLTQIFSHFHNDNLETIITDDINIINKSVYKTLERYSFKKEYQDIRFLEQSPISDEYQIYIWNFRSINEKYYQYGFKYISLYF